MLEPTRHYPLDTSFEARNDRLERVPQEQSPLQNEPEFLAQCDHCAAVLRDGRWEWPSGVRREIVARTCPACQRIADNDPAAHVCMQGRFTMRNAVAIESIIHYVEAAGMGRYPMERTITLTRRPDAITVTTTAARLALRIAEAVDAAYNGRIVLTCSAPNGYLSIDWSR